MRWFPLLLAVGLLDGAAVLKTSASAGTKNSAAGVGDCPLRDDTSIVYSLATGVGPGSRIWVQDFLWWWAQANTLPNGTSLLKYQALDEAGIQNCKLSQFSNLRLFINPGGNAYDQLTALGETGVQNVRDFVWRSAGQQSESDTNGTAAPQSGYAGFCAGGYMAAHDFIWESMYEGVDYYNFRKDPPFNFVPHTVEGSLVDLTDDQFGDQFGYQYRLVNVSNGHQMFYYGGSSFGYNGAPAVHEPASPDYDPLMEVVLYYTDFYGHLTFNLPAAWKYRNAFLTSIHAEADNCSVYDCPTEGSIPVNNILQNRAWLAEHLNNISGLSYKIPTVPLPPSFDTTPPHSSYPTPHCRRTARHQGDVQLVFCDDFDTDAGEVASGLWQWQRNQSNDMSSQPWNTTFLDAWKPDAQPGSGGGTLTNFGSAQSGNGWAVAVPMSDKSQAVTITTHHLELVPTSTQTLNVSFYYKGMFHCRVMCNHCENFSKSAKFRALYFVACMCEPRTGNTGSRVGSGFIASAAYDGLDDWYTILSTRLADATTWQYHSAVFASKAASSMRLKFTCITSANASDNFCGVDTVAVSAVASAASAMSPIEQGRGSTL